MVGGLAAMAGTIFLLDRVGGTAVTLTLWHDEDAALVSDQYAESSRAATVAATGMELTERGRYEVVFEALR